LSVVDYWQTIQIHATFHSRLLHELETQAQRDRLLFDQYFRTQEQLVQLFAQRTVLHHYVGSQGAAWQKGAVQPTQWSEENPPPWLPPRSLMRNMMAASYILLFNKERQLQEIFTRQESQAPLSPFLLQRMRDIDPEVEANHVVRDLNETIYLISAGHVLDNHDHLSATVAMVAPIDDEFLSIFHTTTEANNIVVLINGLNEQVFASSRPDRAAVGQSRAQLEKENLLFGKLLDYGSVVQLPIHFISMVPLTDVDRLSHAVIQNIRHQFVLGYGILALLLLTIVVLIIHKVQTATEQMIDVTVQQLGLQPQQPQQGDQLYLIEQQLHWMTAEILHSRQQEQTRQEELQQINASLRVSLQTIQQAHERLVASEKLASLGSRPPPFWTANVASMPSAYCTIPPAQTNGSSCFRICANRRKWC
jgi:hypothetical protein